MGGMGAMGAGMWIMMAVWLLIVLGLLVLAGFGVVSIARGTWRAPRSTERANLAEHADPAEQELRRRFAAGEIDRDDYQQRLAELRAR